MVRKIIKATLNSNMIWAVIAVVINCGINLTIVPYITERLGVEAYGFVTLANMLVTYVDVISIALNAFASRFIAIEYHQGNYEKASMYFTSAFFSNIVLGIIILIPCLFVIPNIELFLNVSQELQHSVKILFVIVLARYILVLIRNAFDVSTFIKNRLDLTEKIRVLSYTVQAILLFVLCGKFQPELWYVGLATLVAAAILLFVQIYFSYIFIPEIKIKRQLFSKSCIKDLLVTGIWNSINNLGNILNSGLDVLIANKMLSGFFMGMISVSKSLGSLCYTVVVAISGSFRPDQLKSYSAGNIQELVNQIKKSMRITGSICGIIIGGFLVCGREFLELWIPSQNHGMLFKLTIIVLMSDILVGVVNPLYYVFTLTKKLKVPCIITICMGIVNVVSKLFLIKYTKYGDYAVVLTTMLINFVHFFDTPLYSAHCLKISMKTFYPTIFRHMINTIIVSLMLMGINIIYPNVDGWFGLILKIAVFGLLGVGISAVIMTTKGEKSVLVRGIVRK